MSALIMSADGRYGALERTGTSAWLYRCERKHILRREYAYRHVNTIRFGSPDDGGRTVGSDTTYTFNGRSYAGTRAIETVACRECEYHVLMSGRPIHGSYSATRKCDPRCTGAKGPDCECQCTGANHGADYA